jgi:hypothetical protein
MTIKIHCPLCHTLLSETLTAAELKENHNPCDILTRQHTLQILPTQADVDELSKSKYEPKLIPGCPKDLERKTNE